MSNRLTAYFPGAAGDSADPAHLPEVPLDPGMLTDESRLRGNAEKFFCPQSEAELCAILKSAAAAGRRVTVSGGRTGITGGAVPMGGWLVSLSKMNRIPGLRHDSTRNRFSLCCQPGVTLETVQAALEKKIFEGQEQWLTEDQAALALFRQAGAHVFPPDPTERSASLGGMVACNASGARTLFYGPTRNHITRLRVALVGGAVLELKRGEFHAASDGAFELVLPGGSVRAGRIPAYRLPAVKNAAGYFSAPEMDLLDLFIGSEGTLGVYTKIELALIPAPEIILGVIGFFPAEREALAFVRAARGETAGAGGNRLRQRPLALEYFDANSLDLLRDQKHKQGPTSPIPALPDGAHTAVYIELAPTEAETEATAEALMDLLAACGSGGDTAWTALTAEETERLKAFRHALPETINQRIGERALACPGLTKLGTDFAVPDAALEPMMTAYREKLDAAGLEYIIFGHIGNNHVHVNILPRDLDEYARGKTIYLELARQALGWGGTVSGEHGIGKLKKAFLEMMFGAEGVAAMRAVKRVFDPAGLLNPGNMFDW